MECPGMIIEAHRQSDAGFVLVDMEFFLETEARLA